MERNLTVPIVCQEMFYYVIGSIELPDKYIQLSPFYLWEAEL